jgi:hypothetical protein
MLDNNHKTITVQDLDNNNSNFGSLHMNTIYIYKLYSVFQLHEIVILSRLRGCYSMRIDKDNKVTKTIRGKHRSRALNITEY